MAHIYYLIGIVVCFYYLDFIITPIKADKLYLEFRALSMKYKGVESNRVPKEHGWYPYYGLLYTIVLIWFGLGCLTFQWPLMCGYLLMSLTLVSWSQDLLGKSSVMSSAIRILWSFVGFGVTSFAIINHYHLRIDILGLIMNHFN